MIMTFKKWAPLATGLAAAIAMSAPAVADNLEKLSAFKSTGASFDIKTIEQGGDYAEQLRRNLSQIKLPAGFKIDLYAIVPDARHMAMGPQGVVLFVGTRKADVWAVTDRS